MTLIVTISLYLLIIIGVFSLIFLQNSRSIYLRVLGLIIIFLTAVLHYVFNGFTSNAPYILTGISLLGLCGILSDIYSATLRTWYFSVANSSMIATTYGIMIAILVLPLLGINIAHALIIGTLLGSLVGEIKAYGRNKSPVRVMKSVLGTTVGLYGMAIKILIGIEMIDIFLMNT